MAENRFLQSPLDKLIEDSKGYQLPKIDLPSRAAPDDAAPARAMRSNGLMPPQDLQPLFEEASAEFGVPLNVLAALGQQESSYNTSAVGVPTKWGRAKGLMQYIDPTASSLGINPFDPKQAVRAAAQQMRERLDNGYSMEEAIMAHHGGDDRRQWGPKTQRYVQEVMGKAGAIGQGFMQNAPKAEAFDPAAIQAELDAKEPGRYKVVMPGQEPPSPLRPDVQQEMNRTGASPVDAARLANSATPADPAQSATTPQASSPATADAEGGVMSDAGNLLWMGTTSAAQNLRELVGRIPFAGESIVKAVDSADRYLSGKDSQEILKASVDASRKQLTPEQSAALAKAWWDDEKGTFGPAWSDPRAYAGGIIQSLPETVLTMGAAGRLAKAAYARTLAKGASQSAAAAAAARTAMVAGGVTEGLLGGAGTARQVRDEIMGMKPEQLAESEAYRALLDEGMPPADAQKQLAEDAATQGFLIAGAATGIFGGMGDRVLADMITGRVSASLAGRIAKGAVAEGVFEELPQSMAQKAAENYAVQSADPSRGLSEGVLNEGLGGLAVGGVMGGGMGAVASPRVEQQQDQAPQERIEPTVDGAAPTAEPGIDGATPAAEPAATTPEAQAPTTPAAEVPEQVAPAPVNDNAAPAAAPELPRGPLSRAASAVIQQSGEPVTIQSPDGEIGGVLESFVDKGNGQWVARVAAADGNTYDFTHEDGVNIVRQQAPSIAGGDIAPEVAAPATVEQAALAEQSAPVGEPVQVEQQQDESAPSLAIPPRPVEQPAPRQPEAPEPRAPEQPAPRAPEPSYEDMSEPELRARMKYLAGQAKANGGWDKLLTAERKKVEKAINALVEQQQAASQMAVKDAAPAAPEPVAAQPAADQTPVKWFGTQEKADAFIAKKGMADTHEVVPVSRSRFEIREKADQSPAATEMIEQAVVSQQVATDPAGPQPGQKVTLGKGRQAGTVVDVTQKGVKVQTGTRVELMSLAQFNKRLAAAEQAMDAPAPVMDAPVNTAPEPGIDSAKLAKKAKALREKADRMELAGGDPQVIKSLRDQADRDQPAKQPAASVRLMRGDWVSYPVDADGNRATGEIVEIRGKNLLVVTDDGARVTIPRATAEYVSKVTGGSQPAEQGSSESTAVNDELTGRRETPPATAEAEGEAQPETPAAEAKPAVSENKIFTEDAAEKARALLRSKLTQMNSGIDPEIMQAGITLAGYHIEKGARTFAAYADAMLSDMGEVVRPYLKSWYLGVRFDPRAAGFDGMSGAADVENFDLNGLSRESQNVPSAAERVERDRQDAGAEQSVVQEADGNARAGDAAGAGRAGESADGQPGAGRRDQRVPGDRSAAGGKRGDQPAHRADGQFEPSVVAAGDTERAGSGVDSLEGQIVEQERAAAVVEDAAAPGSGDLDQRLAAQRKAQNAPTKWGDKASIDAALPLLLPEQRDDVLKAEQRLAKHNGILFTNGTGTGKTASGLGVAKRHINAGKDSVLVVVPSDKIAADWVKFAGMLGIELKQLKDTTDNGKSGPAVTTYANFGQNQSLAQRDWDLLIADESHYLSSNENGDGTAALEQLRALTGHHAGFYAWARQRHAKEWQAYAAAMKARGDANGNLDVPMERYAELEVAEAKAREKWEAIEKPAREKWDERWAKQEGLPKTVLLSATPFAYAKNTDYAEGYLFHYVDPASLKKSEGNVGDYNSGSARDRFMMQHFGYRMRYNKLTAPEAGVNSQLMEQQFNEWLKSTGALSGRRLEVPFDYDRKFVLVDDAVGTKIDDGLKYLREAEDGKYREVYEAVMKQFDYQRRMYLLESMKARASVPIIREHLDMGRKVVVFHDYNQGGGFNPFSEAIRSILDADVKTLARSVLSKPMFKIDFTGLFSPIETLTDAFPEALLFNGTISKGQRRQSADLFNDDESGRNLIVVQSDAGREGVSLHDTSGKHQRVLLNLGMPVKPVAATQIEGRTYRTGQASDAVFRYLTTGTAWEASAFASKIAERASTAENLALGSEARGLKEAFIEAYQNADAFPASAEDGKGGKDYDRQLSAALTANPFERAKTFYWAQQKNTKRRDQREGADYFATPEPVGFKMVEWAGIQPNDKVLEPSAGHGAIARFFPEQVDVTMVEPSYELSQRAALANGNARIVNDTFEQLHVTNKYDAIVMNPPYGSGGKTSTEHLAKAAKHLRDGGRIVALLPRGGMADKRLGAFLESDEAADLFTVARIDMPAATFERAGTSVNTQVLVLEKHANPADADGILQRNVDLSNAESVNELFDRIESLELPPRRPSSTPAQKEEIVEHTTTKGKLLKGVIRTDLTQDEAKEIDPFTFRKKNAAGETGWFLRLKNLGDAAPRYSLRDGVPQAEFGPVAPAASVAEAVERLMSEQTGEAIVPHEALGEISIVYGNGGMGLAHIAKRRGESFMRRLPDLIENGALYTKPGQAGRVFLGTETDEAAIRLDWNGEAKTWLVSAYEKYPELQPATAPQQGSRSQVVAERTGKPMSPEDVRLQITKGMFGDLVNRMIGKGMIVIHSTSKTLPKGMGKGKRGIQAVTEPSGTVHLVANNLTPETANGVLLHEMFHSGTEALVGSKLWGDLMGRLGSLRRQAEQSRGKAGELLRRAESRVQSAKAQGAIPTRMENEEFGAYLIEEYEIDREAMPSAFRRWVEDVIGAIKAYIFSRYGKQLGQLTAPQLRALAKDALLVQGIARRGELYGPKAEWFSVTGEEIARPDEDVRYSVKPSKAFSDLDQAQKDFLDKIGPERLPQRLADRMRQLTDNLGLRIRQAGVDRYAALLRNDQALLGADTLDGSIASSAWVLARMSHAAGGAVSSLLNNGRIYLDPQEKVIDVREGTEGLADVFRQLGSPAEIDRFMGWIAANRAKRLMAEDRENLFTGEEIEAGMKLSGGKLENGKSRSILYAKAWKEFQQHRDDVLGVAEQAGIITPEQRETWSEEFYVPFYRVIDEENIGGPSSSSGLSRQQAYKKLKGGKQKLNDLLDNTLLNFHHLLQASLKNQAAAQAVQNAEQLGIAEKTTEAKRDKKLSTFVMEAGQKQWYNISDPLTFKAVSALSNSGLNTPLMKAGRAFKRFFTNMTTITPQFVVANALRDTLSAMATSPTSAVPFKTALKGAMTYGNDHNRARMMASGAAFSFGHVYGQSADELKASLTGAMRKAQVLRDPALIPGVLLGAWRKYHAVTDFAENINRAGIWERNLEKGKLKAAFEARDLMDFSAHGDAMIIRIMTDLVPFLNARIQGLDKLYRSGFKPGAMTLMNKGTKADRQAFARFGAVVGALAVMSTLLFLQNWDDDEYRKLEDWQRDTYWVIRIGDDMFFIPKPFEVGAIATMGERLAEQFVDPSVGGDKFAKRLGHMLTDTFAFNPIPQMIKPLYELGANEDTFTGRPIEDQSMARLSPSLRSRPETSRLADAASRGMEAAFGVAGGQDLALSPVQIDHLIKGYTGAVGATAVGLADTLWRRAHGEELPARRWHEYQPIKRFYRDLTEEPGYTRYGTDFYEALKKADRAYADLMHLEKYGDAARADALAEKKADELAMRKALNAVRRDLSEISAEMKRVQMDKAMSGEAKRMELDRLRSQRNMITEEVGKDLEKERIRKIAAE